MDHSIGNNFGMRAKNTYCLILLFVIFGSCSADQNDPETGINTGVVDSTVLYSFFLDKISPTWNYSAENDSVTFKFDKYGLPESRSEIKMIGSSAVHFSIE